jgi:phosphopantetheinyl transferase (holo-ACP synthase)
VSDAAAACVTVDVVDLRRLERIAADFGPALERRLLHPVERERLATLDADGRVRRVGAALGAKEAWIKARARRPPGWTFDRAALLPACEAAPPAAVQALLAAFVGDLGVTAVETGRVVEDPDLLEPSGAAPPGSRWAWHGRYDHWLIAALLR